MTNAMPTIRKSNPVSRFVLATGERAIKTAAQTALATLGGGVINVWHIPVHESIGIVAGATIASVLTSLASVSVGESGTPSAIRGTQ